MKINNGKRWNNGNLALLDAPTRRVRACCELPVGAPTGRVRALLADPTRWLEPDAVLETGRNRSADLWSDRGSARMLLGRELTTFWAATGSRAGDDGCQYAVVVPGQAMGRLELGLGGAAPQLSLTLTALSADGNALLDDAAEQRMQRWLGRLAAAIGRCCRGEAPSAPAPKRLRAVRPCAFVERIGPGDPRSDFVLACPVRELEWITDWQFDLLYSESGRNELDNVFVEPISAVVALRCPGTNTTWYTTRWDPARFRFEAVLLAGDLALGRWTFTAEPLSDNRVRRRLSLDFTALDERGNRILAEAGARRRLTAMLGFVLTSLECYLETGKKYRVPRRTQLRLAASVIGAAIGRGLSRPHGARGAIDEGAC